MNKHPHEEVILAYYRGEQIEWRFGDDEKWRPVSVYRSNKPGMEICPSFDYDVQYRIKPQPPKLHTVELTQQEIEALYVVLRRVGGAIPGTARKHCETAYGKFSDILPDDRAQTLMDASAFLNGGAESRLLEGRIRFKTELPA